MERILKFTELTLKHGKSQKGPWTMALFTGDDSQVYQTFDAGLRNQGEAAVQAGSQVSIVYEQETRNNFTNNVLKSIEVVPEAPGSRSNGTEQVQNPMAFPSMLKSVDVPGATSSQDEFRRSKYEMRRTEAAKIAVELLKLEKPEDQTPETFHELVDYYTDFLAS